MKPINTRECNRTISRDHHKEATPIPVKVNTHDGTISVYWEPSVEERAAIAHGANIKLSVIEETLPPVTLEISYLGSDGPVLVYEDTVKLLTLAKQLDESIEHGKNLKADLGELLKRYDRCRKIVNCPADANLDKFLMSRESTGATETSRERLIKRIREASRCPEGASLVHHIAIMSSMIEEMKNEIQELTAGCEEDEDDEDNDDEDFFDDDDEDDDDDDGDDWYNTPADEDEEE